MFSRSSRTAPADTPSGPRRLLTPGSWTVAIKSLAAATFPPPGDLVTLADALLAGELVKPGNLKLMWTSQKLRDGKNTGYGMGWGVGQFEGEDIAAHAGGQQGASSSLTIYPKRKMVVAVMINMDEADATQIDHQISAVLLKDVFGVESDSQR